MSIYDDQAKFIKVVRDIINAELDNHQLLFGDWRFGTVDAVINSRTLMIFVDGSTVSQQIPCNPDVTFAPGDSVWVKLINRDSKSKFVLCKRF